MRYSIFWSVAMFMAIDYANVSIRASFLNRPKRISHRHNHRAASTLLHAKGDTKQEGSKPLAMETGQPKESLETHPAKFIDDNGIHISKNEDGCVMTGLGTMLMSREQVEGAPEKPQVKGAEDKAVLIDGTPDVNFEEDVEMTREVIFNFNRREMEPFLEETAEGDKSESTMKHEERGDDNVASSYEIERKPGSSKQYGSANGDKRKKENQSIHALCSVDTALNEQITDMRAAVEEEGGGHKQTAIFFKRPAKPKGCLKEQPATVVPKSGFNVVLTHCTADFDSLASAVGLAKLWASTTKENSLIVGGEDSPEKKDFDSASHVPTFVVLPRGAHPGVRRFLALHKHLFPIRSMRSLPNDLTGLNRLGLVDAQRRDRIGPAENLLQYAKRVTVVDHHVDSDTDITEATDYVVDQVGSVSTLIAERLQHAKLDLTEAEATLLALGIHSDTGSLCYDSTTPRDAMSLAWVMSQGASQAAIAEHAQSSLSPEQQGVLTQALINTNTTVKHGVTLSTVLLSADGFINGLAAVTQDALELSTSDIFLLAVVYEAQSGGKKRSKGKKNQGEKLTSRLLTRIDEQWHPKSLEGAGGIPRKLTLNATPDSIQNNTAEMAQAQEAWRGGKEAAMRRRRLQAAFDRHDEDASGYLEQHEIAATLAASGIVASDESVKELIDAVGSDGDGQVNFEEFVNFAFHAEKRLQEQDDIKNNAKTMIIIGRVKAGVNMKGVKLNRLLERFGGGGHAKAASATLRLNDESEAEGILQDLVDEIVSTSLQEQVTVGDFMTAPVLSVKPHMTEMQVEDLFTRYDVRALPVVDDENRVIGLVTSNEVAAAKQRLWNKDQKRLRREKELAEKGETIPCEQNLAKEKQRKAGSTVKGWMKQHIRLVEDSTTMAELEVILVGSDVGCIPVVAKGTKKLIGMVTRTDLLRQHRYYPSLHYHNKGFADSISARKPIIELRKRLKKFDLENE